MENEFYLKLITRYLDGSASLGEAEELLNWLKADRQHMELFAEVKDIWLKSSILNKEDKETELALLRFKLNLTNKNLKKQKALFWNFKNVAAIFIIIFLTGALALSLFRNYKPTSSIAFSETIIPNGQKGKVVLSDGTKIILNYNRQNQKYKF
jgi:ferric-dicitrate binding protein FerR (iron transport regulator)